MFFSSLPGNPLTPEGLMQRQNNAASRGDKAFGALSKYIHSLPGNPLTPEGLQQRLDDTSPSAGSGTPPSARAASFRGSSGGSGAAAPSAKSLDYLNAELASYYGMSKETAYSEALSNTAYQRAVKDMQAAGLNPAVLFGAGRAQAADGVSYIKSASGGSGGSGSRRSSGRKSSGKLLSGSAYSVMSALGGIVGAAATKSAGGYWLGTSLTQGAMSALNLLTGHKG